MNASESWHKGEGEGRQRRASGAPSEPSPVKGGSDTRAQIPSIALGHGGVQVHLIVGLKQIGTLDNNTTTAQGSANEIPSHPPWCRGQTGGVHGSIGE